MTLEGIEEAAAALAGDRKFLFEGSWNDQDHTTLSLGGWRRCIGTYQDAIDLTPARTRGNCPTCRHRMRLHTTHGRRTMPPHMVMKESR